MLRCLLSQHSKQQIQMAHQLLHHSPSTTFPQPRLRRRGVARRALQASRAAGRGVGGVGVHGAGRLHVLGDDFW